LFYSAVVNIGFFLLAVNTILYLFYFRKGDAAWKIFAIYMVAMSIIQAVTSWMSSREMNNLFISHYYFILQFLFLSFFYLKIIDQQRQKKIIHIGLVACPVILGIHFASDPSLYFTFNLFEVFITSFLPIMYAMFHFYNILSESKRYYYINCGIFTYLFASTVLFMFGNLIITVDMEINNYTWALNAIVYISYQIFIFIEWTKKYAEVNSDKNDDN